MSIIIAAFALLFLVPWLMALVVALACSVSGTCRTQVRVFLFGADEAGGVPAVASENRGLS